MLNYHRQQIKDKLDEILESMIGDPNDQDSRDLTAKAISSYMDHHCSRLHYHVVCDGSNNPPESIDQGILTVDVFVENTSIKPFERIRGTIDPRSFYNVF